jgi:predicted RND superfamily exporter protein
MLDADSPQTKLQTLVKSAFPGEHELTVLFKRRDGAALTTADLCSIRTWSRRIDFKSQQIDWLQSPFGFRIGKEEEQTLRYPELLPLDCAAEVSSSKDPLAPLADSPLAGIVASPKGDAVIVDLFLRGADEDGVYGNFDPALVDPLKAELDQTFPEGGPLAASIGGSAACKWYFVQSLMKDQGLNLLVMLIVCVSVRLIFGTWRGGIIMALSLVFTTTVLFALMGLSGTPVDILSNSLFTIVALATTEDFIYISQVAQESRGNYGWRTPFRRQLLPCFYTSISTVIGFGSLCLSDLAPVRRLGFWAAAGSMLEFAVMFFLVPAAMAIWPKLRPFTSGQLTRTSRGLLRLSRVQLPRPVFRGLMLLLGLACFGALRIDVQDSIENLWDPNHPFNHGIDELREHFGFSGSIDLVLKKSASIEDHRQVLDTVRKIPGVVKIEDPYRVLDFASKNLSPSKREILQREFALARAYERWFSTKEPLVRATVFVAQNDIRSLRPIRERLAEICAGDKCFVAGDLMSFAIFSDSVIRTLIESFAVSVVLVVALLIALSRSLEKSGIGIVIVSSIWGPSVLLGMLPLVIGSVNFVTCLFAAVLVGLAGDSAVQFLFASRRGNLGDGVNQRGLGSLQMTAVAVLASFAYLSSSFAQPRVLGVLFASGYIGMLIGDLWVLKGFLGSARPPKTT